MSLDRNLSPAEVVGFLLVGVAVIGWLALGDCGPKPSRQYRYSLSNPDPPAAKPNPPVSDRAAAPEDAERARDGGPTACSAEDIAHAEVIAKEIDRLPDGADGERAFRRAAKALGVTRKEARVTWDKVRRVCPEAL